MARLRPRPNGEAASSLGSVRAPRGVHLSSSGASKRLHSLNGRGCAECDGDGDDDGGGGDYCDYDDDSGPHFSMWL